MKCLVSNKLSQRKFIDNSGYLICTDAILARTGSMDYMPSELGIDSEDHMIKVEHRKEDLIDPAVAASFENKPLTLNHPSEDVTPENRSELSYGYVRDVHIKDEDGYTCLVGTIVVTDQQAIDMIQNGEMTELSCGYDCDIMKDDKGYYQTKIRGNHVALCEAGRAGIAKIRDSKRWEVGDRVRFEGKWYYIVGYSRGDWLLEPEDAESPYDRIRVRADDSKAKDGHFTKGTIRERLQEYLDWEGIYGYDVDRLMSLARKDRLELKKYLENEGIFGYDGPIYDIVVNHEKAWIDDSKVTDANVNDNYLGVLPKQRRYKYRGYTLIDHGYSSAPIEIEGEAKEFRTLEDAKKYIRENLSVYDNKTFYFEDECSIYRVKAKTKDSAKDALRKLKSMK